jgi:predicted acyltransferase (DUF342 family)
MGGKLFVVGDASFNNRLFLTNDASLNQRLFVGSDASFGSRIFAAGDVSLNSRLYVGGDVSFGGRIFAMGDVSLNNRLYVAWDVSLGDNLFVIGDVSLNNRLFVGLDVSLGGRLFTRGDVSLNSRLFVGSDVFFGGRLFAVGDVSFNNRLFLTGDASMNSRLFVGSDISLGGRLFVVGDASFNQRLFLTGDASMNSRLFVGSDISLGGRLFVVGDASFNQRLFLSGDASMNSRLFVGSDASFGGRIFATGDVSLNNRLYVAWDVSLGDNLFVVGDVSINSRFFVGSDVSFGGRLFLTNDASLNGNVSLAKDLTIGGNLYVKSYTTYQTITTLSYQLIVAEDISSSGRLFLAGDGSFNNRLFVASDVSMGGRLFTVGDTSHNARLFVGSDASFGGRIYAVGDVSLNSRLNVGSDASFNGRLYLNSNSLFVNGVLFTGGSNNFTADVSMNSRLYVGSDVSLGGRIYVVGDASFNRRLYVGGDVSFGGNLSTGPVINFTTGGSITNTTGKQANPALLAYTNYSQISFPRNSGWITTDFSGQYLFNGLALSTNYGLTYTIPSVLASVGGYDSWVTPNGRTMIAICYQIAYISKDYGATWNTLVSSAVQSWYANSRIVCDNNATYFYATGNGNVFYMSTDGGTTWTNTFTITGTYAGTTFGFPSRVISCYCNSTGQYAVISGYYYYGLGTIAFMTNNYGASWNSSSVNPGNYTDIWMSENGKYIWIGGYLSSDYGVTFTVSPALTGLSEGYGSNTHSQFAASANGDIMIMYGSRYDVWLKYSKDYGVTWTQITGFPGGNGNLAVYNNVISGNGDYNYMSKNVTDTSLNRAYISSMMTTGFSLAGNTITTGMSTVAGDISMGGRLFLSSDASMNSRLFVGSYISTGGALFTLGDVSMNANAYVSKNLNIGISGNFYPVDISGTVNIRGAVNPLTLIDGSILMSSNPPIDLSSTTNSFGRNWTQFSNSISSAWSSIAMSANGQYQTAVASGTSSIYTSSNFGMNWTINTSAPTGSWYSVAMSSSGQYQVAVINGTYVYLSSDYGITWSNSNTTTNPGVSTWQQVAMSVTGQYVSLAGPSSGLWVSSNYGVTWTKTNGIGNFICIVMSATGQYQVAGGYNGISMYYSRNYGVTWTSGAGGSIPNNNCIAMSANGQYILASQGNGGYIISSNYGTSYVSYSSISANAPGVAVSATGQYMMAVRNVSTNQYSIYCSTNYGVTWALSNANIINWSCFAISANGQYVTGVVNGGYIYSSNTPYANLSVSTNSLLMGDVSMNSRLFVGSDASFGGRIRAVGDVSLSSRLFVGSDVSLGGRLFLINDASLNGNVSLAKDLTIGGNLYVNNYTTRQTVTSINYQLILAEDLSSSGRLFLVGDASFNNRLYVGADVSMGGRLFTVGDTSHNARLYVGSDVSLGGRLFAVGDVSLNSRLYVGSDVSMNGNLSVTKLLKPTAISENFVTNATTASSYTFDYSTGSVFYITAPPSTNFTCNFTNLPADINRNYVITVIINSTTNKTFCSSVQINSNTAISPVFANGMPTSMNFGTMMTQSIAIQRVSAGDLAANVNVIASLTPYSSASTGNYLIASAADASLSYRLYVGGNIYATSATASSSTSTGGLQVTGGAGIAGNVFVGGNVVVSSSFKPTIITEPFATNTGTTSPYTFDYSTGPTFYVTTPPASNFTCNFTNVPADINRTYVATIVIKTSSNRTFCNTVQINSNATTFTPYFANGIPTSIATASMITQTISIQRLVANDAGPNGTNSNVLSAVIAYY